MIEPETIKVLAVDGGGTRCRVALQADADIVSVETGSANVSTDFDGSVQQISGGLKDLAAKSGIDLDVLVGLPAFVGLAGVTGPEIADRLRAALPLANVRIDDDRPAALRAALGPRDGVIAHCGTGSFFGAQISGQMAFAGGWGPVLGDEASAQWIGRAALRGALEATDGRGTMSGLATLLLDRFGGAAGIVRFGGTARPSEFGALAPLVTEHAAKGDGMAIHVMAAGAAEIARSLPRIGWQQGMTICLTGGIGPHFESFLPRNMHVDVAPPAAEPLSGALSLAEDRARESRQ